MMGQYSKHTTILISFFFVFFWLSISGGVYAQDEAGLEEILSGFENNEKSDEDFQEVIEGFDDESQKEKEKEEK